MKYSTISPSRILKQRIQIDENTIFLVLPDTNLDISVEIYNTKFLLSNCKGLVSPNKIITIGNRKFNGKIHFYDLMKKMAIPDEDQKIGRKLKVLNSLTIEKEKKEVVSSGSKKAEYYFYDMSIWSKAIDYLLEKFAERTVVQHLFGELEELYKQLKATNPTYNIEVLFLIKNTSGKLFNIFSNIRTLSKAVKLEDTKFFDRYGSIVDCEGTFVPIFNISKGQTKAIVQNLPKLEKYIEMASTVSDINAAKESPIVDKAEDSSIKSFNLEGPDAPVEASEDKEDNVIPSQENPNIPPFIKNMVQSLQTSKLTANIDPDTDKLNINLNQRALKQALKTHKITDPDIVANVQIALNNYINSTKTKPTQEQAEDIVLRAINYTVSGDDKVPEEYLHNPELLFSKLKEINTYKVPLKIPESDEIVDASKIVDLKYTTGQHRQKFEFETAIHENITKLFKSLESVGHEYPIRVENIVHTIEDDNSNRYINYKVTLRNVAGGKKEPYTVELKVPSPVNEKYFKIHGNSYIMSNQQFLRPVTKTDINEVRMLSSYGIVRVGLLNSKFNPTDIQNIIKYIQIKYPELIKKSTDEFCKFSDNSIVYFTGESVYSSSDTSIITDPDTGRLQDANTKEILNQSRYEFLFDTILNKIKTINPADNLTTTKKSLPYISIYLGGLKMPLLLFLWSQKGLLLTLNDFGIDYEIVDKVTTEKNVFYLELADGKFLKIKPETLKQRLLVNALYSFKFKQPINDVTDPQEIYDYIIQLCGSKSIIRIRLLVENFIDPITKELLQFENMPTNLIDLSSKVAVDQLLNKKPDSLSDLKIYRARLSEIILHIVYKQIKLAHNYYRKLVLEENENATIFLDQDYVINSLLTDAGILQQTEPTTPVNEIMLSSRVIKSGKGGVPSKRSFKKEHRNIHKSHFGNLGAVSTPEYVDVGLTCHHTLSPIIINKYGSYGTKDILNLPGWQSLTLDEALTPFQNQVDSDRLTLARTHANQATPISNSEQPIVSTGAESIVSQLASPRFVHRAKKDGEIVEVIKNKTMTIKYKDGSIDIFDIVPRLSRTKRGSYISLEMNTLNIGDKFKANQPVAFTKNFSNKGVYSAGKNLSIAVLNYLGLNHEDSYIITNDIAKETTTDFVSEIQIIVPPDTKILNIIKEQNKHVANGEVLVEFSYDDGLDDYLDRNQLEDDDSDDITQDFYSAGAKSIKLLAPEGEIIGIKMFINNKNSTDNQLIKFHSQLVKEQKTIIAKLASNKTNKDEKLSITDNMDLSFFNIGNHKVKGNIFVGTRIVYYIKHAKHVNIGDKISNRYGAKGVISKILDTPPKGSFTEKIDVFISPISIIGRKNIAMIKELFLGKIFFYANKKLDEMAEDSAVTNDKLAKFIIDFYNIIGPEKVAKLVVTTIGRYSGNALRQAIKNDKINLLCMIEPFEDITFESIRSAAEFINIPLEEKVFIPELNKWTDVPVPVGISYYMFLEHYSGVYSNIRGTGRFVGLTRQPTKKKSQEGGQSISGLDIYALLTYDANHILSELLGPRSDEHKAKRELYNAIIESGETQQLPVSTKTGGSKDIFNLYITGMGLDVS